MHFNNDSEILYFCIFNSDLAVILLKLNELMNENRPTWLLGRTQTTVGQTRRGDVVPELTSRE